MHDDRLTAPDACELFGPSPEEIGIAHVGLDGRFLRCNRKLTEITGYSAAELRQLTFQEITHPDDLETDVKLAQRLADGELPTYTMEKRYIRKDGGTVWIRLTGSAVRDEQGGVRYFIAVIEDITGRKQVEEALRQAHAESARHLAQLETVLDNMTEGLVVADLAGNVYHWNRAALAMHGFASLDECRHQLGEFRKLFELAELDGSVVPFEHWPLMRIFNGEHLHNWELRIRRLDRPWERIYAYSGSLVRDAAGAPLLAVLNIEDITERKRGEEALQRYRLIADHSRDIILFIRRSDGRILDANYAATREYGYSHAELLKLTIYDLRAASTLDQVEAQLAAADDRGSLFETIHRRKDGSTFPVGVSSQGSTIGGERMLISVVRDITDRKRYEEELLQARQVAEAASQAKSRFLASMSHEIRTPMTVFLGALEQLQQLDRNPQRRQLLALADQAARRLHALINDILDFSRIEADRVDIEEAPFALRAGLDSVMAMSGAMAREKQLALELDVAPDVPHFVLGDQYRLEQVLINLLGNAVKFTAQGEVRLVVEVRGELLSFTVSDTGAGIPEDKQAMIFDAFSQVDSSATRKFGGTGLGLAISRRLVELMGGTIGVRSRVGVGSEFNFTLPLKAVGRPQSQPLPVANGSGSAPGRFAGKAILLVEDNPLVRDVVLAILAQRQWPAVAVGSGREGVAAWQTGEFAVILMDLQMPDMDGLEATRCIRALEPALRKRAYIIGLTAHAAQAVQDQGRAAGMDEMLVKPFESARLYAAIEKGFCGGLSPESGADPPVGPGS